MEKVIYLVRHGTYDMQGLTKPSRATFNSNLLPEGVKDVQLVGASIKTYGDTIEKIVASPYQRTKDSASILAAFFSTDYTVDERLCETTEDEHIHHDYLGIYGRMNAVIKELLSSEFKTIIVVSHQVPLGTFIQIESGMDANDLTANPENLTLLTMGGAFRLVYENDHLVDCQKLID